mmetsp:Transcript_50681/g.162214  ORF Transcript_50681/g.162214 Transcript_50681/m.162214 type:complete len:463 (-) Transcript_50681:293-1681(-)
MGAAEQNDRAWVGSLDTLVGTHDDEESVAIGGPVMAKYSEVLRELADHRQILSAEVGSHMVARLEVFSQSTLGEVKEMRRRFDKMSEQYDKQRSRYLDMKKGAKAESLASAEMELRNARASCESARFALALHLTRIEHLKKVELLEAVTTSMDAHMRFYRQGYELLQGLEPYLQEVLAVTAAQKAAVAREHAELEERVAEFKLQQAEVPEGPGDAPPPAMTELMPRSGVLSLSFKAIEGAMKVDAGMEAADGSPASTPIKQGYLLKRSSNMLGDWKRRFFVLDTRGKLCYHRGPGEKAKEGKTEGAQHTVDLLTSTIKMGGEDDKKLFTFQIVSPAKVYNLQAESEQDRAEWMDAITGVIASLLNAQVPGRDAGEGGSGEAAANERDFTLLPKLQACLRDFTLLPKLQACLRDFTLLPVARLVTGRGGCACLLVALAIVGFCERAYARVVVRGGTKKCWSDD